MHLWFFARKLMANAVGPCRREGETRYTYSAILRVFISWQAALRSKYMVGSSVAMQRLRQVGFQRMPSAYRIQGTSW